MSKRNTSGDNFFERLGKEYRMTFIDEESLDEVASYKLSMGKLYILISSVFVGVVLITVSIMLLTPLKYYIPGYGNDKARVQTIKLKQTVDSLSDLVAAQQKYEDNIKAIIAGEKVKETRYYNAEYAKGEAGRYEQHSAAEHANKKERNREYKER